MPAFAPTVTQHVFGTPTTDADGDEVPVFVDRSVRALAVGPGNPIENDVTASDFVTGDQELYLDPTVAASEYDEWTLPDGLRYRALGAPSRYRSPFTGSAVTQVNLRRIT